MAKNQVNFIANTADLEKQFLAFTKKSVNNVVNPAIKDSLQEITEKIYAEALATVPVKTGRLKSSIGMKVLKKSAKVFSDADIAWYGYLIEYGTRKHAARPFLHNARDKYIDDLTPLITEKLGYNQSVGGVEAVEGPPTPEEI